MNLLTALSIAAPAPACAMAAAMNFVSAFCLMWMSAILCNPRWQYRLQRRLTWPLAGGGIVCFIGGMTLMFTLVATWRAVMIIDLFSITIIAGFCGLITMPQSRAHA